VLPGSLGGWGVRGDERAGTRGALEALGGALGGAAALSVALGAGDSDGAGAGAVVSLVAVASTAGVEAGGVTAAAERGGVLSTKAMPTIAAPASVHATAMSGARGLRGGARDTLSPACEPFGKRAEASVVDTFGGTPPTALGAVPTPDIEMLLMEMELMPLSPNEFELGTSLQLSPRSGLDAPGQDARGLAEYGPL
jgi:hypothetical protein